MGLRQLLGTCTRSMHGFRFLVAIAVLFSGSLSALRLSAEDTDSASAAKIFAGAAPTSVAELRAMEDLQRRIVQRLVNCTVSLRVNSAQGSGVIISEDGYVLTAAHVAQKPNERIQVILADGRRLEGMTLGLNRNSDAGLAKITTPGTWPHLEMASADDISEGQWCVATGHPGGFERDRKPVVRVGRVLSKQKDLLITDCALVGGDSGGPLVDGQGRVIGIHSRIGTQLTANMHVPVQLFSESWDRLNASEAWGHLPGQTPFLGVQGDQDDPSAKITRVYASTPAEKAGIKPGDVVTKLGDKPVTSFNSLTEMIAECQVGDKVKVTVRRGEETLEFEVTLARRGR